MNKWSAEEFENLSDQGILELIEQGGLEVTGHFSAGIGIVAFSMKIERPKLPALAAPYLERRLQPLLAAGKLEVNRVSGVYRIDVP